MAKTKIGSVRYIKRFVQDEEFACYDTILQQYTVDGWKDIDLTNIHKKIKWESKEQERQYRAAQIKERKFLSNLFLQEDE